MFTQVQIKCAVFWFVASYCSISGYHLSKPSTTLCQVTGYLLN